MNINELDSYNLADAVKFNEELNPRIWQGSRMRPEVRRKLLAIARDFKQSLGLSDLEVKDITLSGSNAGYTYTPHSDIDLHLVVDVPQAETDEVYRELFNAKKYQYNDEHNLAIGGYPVELYVQPANQTHHSQGIYSVLNNDWTAIPRKRESTVNDGAVKSKYELMKHRINSAINSGNIKQLTKTAARIKQMRQAGLDKNGELGPENLAYKMLRTQGLIEKLYTARTAAKDRLLSLQEQPVAEHVTYGFAEDATISPYGVSPTTQMFLNETGDSEQTVHDFISHTAEQLGIENMPHIELHTDPEWSEREHSFGRYTPETHTLEVNLANRHIMDILRTTAHELVHCRQHELSPLPNEAGETGSRWENEAHAKAGVIMRDYADANPEKFGEHALAEASGYIPTRAQVRDPRFSTALTVDVHPGQTGKEANKMALQTDAQGRPALLTKGLANQLHEEFAQFDESTALFEIKMTGKNLRAEAAKTGAIAGMEFEMIVPNMEGDPDDDQEMEPDWEYDESVISIDDACNFFENGEGNTSGDIRRLRERMQNYYYDWLDEQFDSRWDGDELEFIYNYIKENASAEEIAEILGTEPNEDGEYPDPGKQDYLDAANKISEQGYDNQWYSQAREDAQEDYNRNADQEREWLADQDINTMKDVMDTFGNVNWPYYYNSNVGGDRSIDDVANDFQDAIGRDVQASTRYHSGSVDRPSPSSHHYVVEPDGSLDGDNYGDRGLEFVSPPLPIDVILNDLSKVKRWADSYGCYTNDSTGLHINISVPEYNRDKLDFVKLAILMGDEHVSDSFGRLGAYYAKSAMAAIRDNVRSRPEAVTDALEKMRTHMNTAASKAIHAGVTQKFTSINVKDGHIEFRSPGGDWLGENFDKIENTLLRFTVAMSAALNPEMYREEYLKKLYKLLTPEGQKDEYGDMIEEFSKYMVSLQGSGAEASGKLSKETQQAIKDFRTAASKELKQKNLANKLKKGNTAGQKYWWKVSNPGNSNAGIEVVATTKEEAIEKATGEDGYPSWANYLSSLVAKPLSPYYEKSKPSQQTARYEIYNKQTGNSVETADGITNDADALVRLNDYIEHGPHALQRGQASRMFGIRTTNGVEIVDIDIPMAQGRAATSPTGKWKITDGLGRYLYVFRPAENTRSAANELAALWARENNFDGNYQVEPVEDTAQTGTQDQQQGGLIDVVPGSTNDLARQRATPGAFTGAWKVLDADGNELYRFSGVGNNQSDANRVAVQWMQNNGYDHGTEMSVVPVMSESIAEGADKKYTIKKSYTMSKAGVEKSVWHIMDGDFVVDVTDLRRDAKYYADKWNAAEKESSDASQNLHKQGMAEGLNEFAPSSQGGGNSGRWYTDDELADIIGDDWFEDFDVSHDGFNIDTHGEKAKQNLVGYANSWFDDRGYNVNVMGVEHNDVDHDLKWYIVGSFHNPRFANEGVTEASLSTMRDFFAGDEKARDPYEITKQRLHFSKDPKTAATNRKEFRSKEEYEQWAKQNKIVNAPKVNEAPEFFSMPLRMSEYRGKHHPATEEPYDAKFKFSGDLKDRVHSLLDAGTKPKLLQVNPRHLLATQDWLSNQGGGKPPFATMKQHPVVLQKNNKLYILDGHHRSADALNSGSPIEVYLFQDEL